ncbi:MAG: GT4 family glycosyltransferase PelF [Bdellovibrionales bacterium]|jgi:polysaccharide biosynthesis protein PelF|nr:GT4 family glycosyltransferase PelF [Bdellovibrionales bacterium]MBT3526205.1 GT4 family glycosyltransferase PelF [Bdellovibrionales bacterium]MBT7668439.1 GT4 family glycosyltransferase PelF [Bdellovibrionales bacterium]MBT7767952.1 GT4 family glycosyltransferase PelF [Bdellovibrionales bacterium]
MSDVCLVLEGTYPFVSGGVSSCVYQLIRATPQINYFILYLGADPHGQEEYKYPIPSNVQLIKIITLFDLKVDAQTTRLGIDFDWSLIEQFHLAVNKVEFQGLEEIWRALFFPESRLCDPFELFSSQEVWDLLDTIYRRQKRDYSFIDYFYTWRFAHYPLFKVLSTKIPRADIYHALSTGYAGMLASVAKVKYGAPMALTEHGIYTHERQIDISLADWIYNTDIAIEAKKNSSFFKQWWMKLFNFMGQYCYHQADIITTLYGGNRDKQISLGAKRNKIRLIPNGVDFPRLSALKSVNKLERKEGEVIVALVGRVVPIKDIKSFIKAISIVFNSASNFRVLICGPTDEDEEYFNDCQSLVSILELSSCISFPGKVNLNEYYPDIDLMVLSSISEGQPMVILEGFCLAIPCVATNVGSCHELIYGNNAEDRALGAAGEVVPFGKPDLLAAAMIKLINNSELRRQCGEVGRKRVQRFYQENTNIDNYLELYQDLELGI